jgi:hypothetical protein
MRPTRAEWALLGLALGLRLWLVSHATWLPVSDTRDYHELAASLASGRGYVQIYEGELPEYRGLTFQAFRMPGYPALLAILYSVFGWDHRVGFAANVACDLGTQLLVLLLARRLLHPAAGLAAQALVATHVVWTPSLMTESLFTFLFTALVSMVAFRRAAVSATSAVGFGLLLAGAFFVRPIAVAVLPAACAQALGVRPGRRSALLVVLMLVPLTLGVTAWTMRNHARLGDAVLLTTNLGPHNARTLGIDRARVVEEIRRQGGDETEINDALLAEVGQIVRERPAWAAMRYLRRGLELFSLGRPWEVRALLSTRTFASPGTSVWAQRVYTVLLVQYYVTYPLALAGAILLVRARRPLHGVWTIVASFVLTHALVSYGNFRLAAPLYPLLCLFAGHGIARLGAWTRSRTH